MTKNDYDVGYGKPPKTNQWQKGQSGNPKGRPKDRSDFLKDAVTILSEPVTAKTQNGGTQKLAGFEAPYLSLCKKALKGHVPSLITAVNIMFEVQPAIDAQASSEIKTRERVLALFEKMGVKISDKPKSGMNGH